MIPLFTSGSSGGSSTDEEEKEPRRSTLTGIDFSSVSTEPERYTNPDQRSTTTGIDTRSFSDTLKRYTNPDQRSTTTGIDTRDVSTTEGYEPPAADDADDADAEESGFDWSFGLREYVESDTYRESQQTIEETSGKTDRDSLYRNFDARVTVGTDFLLDNPNFSFQDNSRNSLRYYNNLLTGQELDDEEFGEAAADTYDRTLDSAGDAIEDTPLDNPVTGGIASIGDAFFGEWARSGFGAATGLDVETGDTDKDTTTRDIFNIGLGSGLGGLTTKTVAKSGDEGVTLLNRLFGGGDEAAGATDEIVVVSDDAAGATTRTADDVAGTADDMPVSPRDSNLSRFLSGGDDAAGAGARASDEFVDVTFRTVDDKADEGASFFKRFLSGSDDAAKAAARKAGRGGKAGAERAAKAAARAGKRGGKTGARTARNIAGNRAVQAGAAAATVGALATEAGLFDGTGSEDLEVTTDDGRTFLLSHAKDYPPTAERQGGTLFSVEEDGSFLGYTLLVDVRGRNVYLLDENGERYRAKVDADQFSSAVAGGPRRTTSSRYGRIE